MTEAVDEEQDVQLTELIGFLQDPKVAVQRLAAEGLLDQTESVELISFCKHKPRLVARQLLRLAERAEAAFGQEDGDKKPKVAAAEAAESAAAGAAALKCLVNLSAVPEVCTELVDMNATRRCCEALRTGWLEGRSELAHWYCMLLANLSTVDSCQKALCKEEGNIRFLFSAFVAAARPPPRDGYDDPMLCLGKVINNVSTQAEGRKILAGGANASGTVKLLADQLADRQRRADVLSTFRNFCLDEECHAAVAGTDFVADIYCFLYPWEKADPTERAKLPEPLQEVLKRAGATLTADLSVRRNGSGSLVGLCLSSTGREYLRNFNCAELARAWQAEEADSETRDDLVAVSTALSKTEEEHNAAPVDVLPTSAPESASSDGYVAANAPAAESSSGA